MMSSDHVQFFAHKAEEITTSRKKATWEKFIIFCDMEESMCSNNDFYTLIELFCVGVFFFFISVDEFYR